MTIIQQIFNCIKLTVTNLIIMSQSICVKIFHKEIVCNSQYTSQPSRSINRKVSHINVSQKSGLNYM